jgi:uncharacterized protein YegP (UPF0339 family)
MCLSKELTVEKTKAKHGIASVRPLRYAKSRKKKGGRDLYI